MRKPRQAGKLRHMIRIGVTGHRPQRLKVAEKKLTARVRGVLLGLMKAWKNASRRQGPVLDVISPLAEGTDRIVAREALGLGQRLTALLPFALSDYEATFSDSSTTKEFRQFWEAASERTELKGLASHSEASYVSVGMVTLARCDVVLTVWDGKRARGRGGTPEILQNALEWGIPIIWVHATDDRKPVLLVEQQRGKVVPRLDRAARHGVELTAARYRNLTVLLKNT